MASIQDKLNNSLQKVNRKLFDNTLNVTGRELLVARVRIEEDKYGNLLGEELVKNDNIVCKINLPEEFPIFRKRDDSDQSVQLNESGSTTGIYLFEDLPFESWFKWKDEVEVDDFIILKIGDETTNELKLVLQVTEALGSIHTHLIWRKYWVVMYNNQLSDQMQLIVDNF